MITTTNSSKGKLFALLGAGFYILFTLIPNSTSLVLTWSWVLLWQVGLLCPVLWLLWRGGEQKELKSLGNGGEIWVGVTILGLLISTFFAEFPEISFWYAWVAVCFLATLYVLNDWLTSPQRRYHLLAFQGYLSFAFILVSLSVWLFSSWFPTQEKLQRLAQQYGVSLSYDFSILELRNWAPLGHQNYVAGFLVLSLPLLTALAVLSTSWRRWLWISATGLGLIDLYTTSSRGGWLGLFVILGLAAVVLLVRNSFPRLWLIAGGVATIAVLSGFVGVNNRLRGVLIGLSQGEVGGLSYRWITNTVGWRMGEGDPLTGVGLGSVPLVYQRYLPIWGGREAELIFQLHSTPAQLWGELGIWGIFALFGAFFLWVYFFWRWCWSVPQNVDDRDRVLLPSLVIASAGYGVLSLTDYQLDVIAISGSLVVFSACLFSATTHSNNIKMGKVRLGFAVGILLAVIVWLIPIHRGWQLSSQGFSALIEDNIPLFVEKLEQAHKTVSWEHYYPYQLGWKWGEMGLNANNAADRAEGLSKGIQWLSEGIEIAPYREFAHSNLGWLYLANNQPVEASLAFSRSVKLVSNKRGVFYGLGRSLLAQGKLELAVEALTLEVMRNPIFITSPLWKTGVLSSIYPRVLNQARSRYTELLEQDNLSPSYENYLHRCRGGIAWWEGDYTVATEEITQYGAADGKLLLNLSTGKELPTLNNSSTETVIRAWFSPQERSALIAKAWVKETRDAPAEELLQWFLRTMAQAETFEDWLKEDYVARSYRNTRTSFGLISRHLDGITPTDFASFTENTAMKTWFAGLLPSPNYLPKFDRDLQPWREELIMALIKENQGDS